MVADAATCSDVKAEDIWLDIELTNIEGRVVGLSAIPSTNPNQPPPASS